MAKRSISLKEILLDMKNGMDDDAVMRKHTISSEQLAKVLNRAIDNGVITQQQLDTLRARGKRKAQSKEAPKSAAPVTPAPAPSKQAPPPAPAAPRKPTEEPFEPEVLPKEAPLPRKSRFPVLLIILIIVVLFIVGSVVAVKLLSWWALAVIPVLGLLALGAIALLIRSKIRGFFTGAFEAKSKALAGAEAIVNSVKPAQVPTPEKTDDEDDFDEAEAEELKQYRWYLVDVTISPQASSEGFRHWEPGDVTLATLDENPKDLGGNEEEASRVWDYKVFIDGAFREDEEGKFVGPQRILYHVGVKPGYELMQFRYYFELFGRVDFDSNAA